MGICLSCIKSRKERQRTESMPLLYDQTSTITTTNESIEAPPRDLTHIVQAAQDHLIDIAALKPNQEHHSQPPSITDNINIINVQDYEWNQEEIEPINLKADDLKTKA